MRLHLVRHGRPLLRPGVAPHHWELDPDGFDDVWALRGRLPAGATWFCSPEPKATQTAQLLTDGPVGEVPGLREHVRDTGAWFEDLPAVVRRAWARPDEPAADGWEPLSRCRERVAATVRALLADLPPGCADVVLVGHGTAWTALVAELTGEPADLDRWAALAMPDLWVVDVPDPAAGA